MSRGVPRPGPASSFGQADLTRLLYLLGELAGCARQYGRETAASGVDPRHPTLREAVAAAGAQAACDRATGAVVAFVLGTHGLTLGPSGEPGAIPRGEPA